MIQTSLLKGDTSLVIFEINGEQKLGSIVSVYLVSNSPKYTIGSGGRLYDLFASDFRFETKVEYSERIAKALEKP